MNKLEEARQKLRHWTYYECDAEHEQAARDFAAAEILERYQRPRPPPGPDENAKTDDEWLRAGGLAKEVGDE